MRHFVQRGEPGGAGDLMERLLRARGVTSPEQARAFLRPDAGQLRDPLALHGMAAACEVIRDTIRCGNRVTVYGDYDCDGVCAAAILLTALGGMGADARAYIPDRHSEGYGLNAAAVRDIAKAGGCLLTVDCGVTSVSDVALARELGLRVVVTDHHAPGDTLPPADALVHPALGDAPGAALCGAGVAWKLACALSGEIRHDLLDLAALATIADMVELLGENRVIAALGLAALADTQRAGLKALLAVAGMKEGAAVTSHQAAFLLAPRINACGRMASADIALELLMTRDAARAEALAKEADRLNALRKTVEKEVLEQALSQAMAADLYSDRAVVVRGEGWEGGVVGLAAGRIAQRLGYPTVALSQDGDICTGSARSAGGVDLYSALKECAHVLTRFGGHKQAAGLKLASDDTQKLRRLLSDAVARQLGGGRLIPQTAYDAAIAVKDITVPLAERLAQLEPFGTGNPEPVFLIENARAVRRRAIGADGAHLRAQLEQGGAVINAVAFGMGHRAGTLEGELTLAVTLSVNEFRGERSAECRVEAVAGGQWGVFEGEDAESLRILQELARLCRIHTESPEMAGEDAPGDPAEALYVCRTAATAQAALAARPGLDIALDGETEPRAYGAVWLCKRLTARGPYRRVVFADGLLCEGELALARQLYPRAAITVCPRSRALDERVDALRFTVDELRGCYRAATRGDMPALTSPKEAAMAHVLADMGLLSLTPAVSLLPAKKADPLASPLYKAIHGEGRDR